MEKSRQYGRQNYRDATITVMNDIIFRLEEEKDYRAVEHLTREAFWNVYKPGCDEHYLAYLLRKSSIFVKELDYVAERNGQIVGNIMYSLARIEDGETSYPALSFGPVSVLPQYQKCGIGSALIQKTLALAKQMGFGCVIIYGRASYYSRFGFVNAAKYHITTKDGDNFDDFMALELRPQALAKIKGKFYALEGIDYINGLEEYDSTFPYKEKLVLPTQLFKE